MLLASASGFARQRGALDLTVEAPASLAPASDRVRRIDRAQLARALARVGLNIPPQIHVTLIAEDDLRARATPVWTVGLASGHRDIAIFPAYRLLPVRLAGVGRLARSRASCDHRPGRQPATAALVSRRRSDVGGERLGRHESGAVPARGRRQWRSRGCRASVQCRDATRSASAYLLAAALVSDLQHRHGVAVPGAILERVAHGAGFAEAFVLETGETPEETAARAWQISRRWTSWLPAATSAFSLWTGICTGGCRLLGNAAQTVAASAAVGSGRAGHAGHAAITAPSLASLLR